MKIKFHQAEIGFKYLFREDISMTKTENNDEIMDKRLDYVKTVFNHNQRLIQLADNKANIIVAIISVLLPIIFGVDIFVANVEELSISTIFLLISFIIAAGLLSSSFYYAILVIKARTKEEFGDLIFFKNIIKKELQDYIEFIKSADTPFFLEDLLKENYALAKINAEKYTAYKISLILLVVSIFYIIFTYTTYFILILFSV